jgi:serine/threonine protein kinase
VSSSDRWQTVHPSQFAHEQEALEVLARGLPDQSPFRAWSNFEFIADDGSINEVDALVVSTDRIYLVEIKSWRGEVSGNQTYWTVRTPAGERTHENPLLLANRKAKKLKSLLGRQNAFKKSQVPFIQAAVFLSSKECAIQLDEIAGQHVYARPGSARRGQANVVDLINGLVTKAEGRPPMSRDVERALVRAMEQLGLRKRTTSAQVGDYRLVRLIDENDLYQDWEAVHVRVDSDRKRVRIFPHQSSAPDAVKRERKDLALREYQLLQDVQHDHILRPIQLTECEVGPALVYPFDADARRLDHVLHQELTGASVDLRLDLVRQLAEALRYAHLRGVTHRALSPWSIEIVKQADRSFLRIRDWLSGAAATSTHTQTRMTLHGLYAGLASAEQAAVYAAPELLSGQDYDAVASDLFSLGALTYAIFSGKHPAANVEELATKCRNGPGLRVSEVVDGAPDKLQELIQFATDLSPSSRPEDVAEFLKLLEDVEDELTTPEPEIGKHPLDAKAGDTLSGGFTVVHRLGSGSTCVALAVTRGADAGVLKVAKDVTLNERVRKEAGVLNALHHPNIVRCLSLLEIDGLAAIFMEQAGDRTLGQRLRSDGALSLDMLQRFGDELLNVLVYLEREGHNHRDIKSENIGIGENRKRALTLKLYDFSLSGTPAENIRAGTPPYLDPFLSARRPARWDLYAERYAAAMTLHEMATATLPTWGNETGEPIGDQDRLRIDSEQFDPAIREGLTKFFERALHRDYRKRYDNADQMEMDWRMVFQDIDQTGGDESDSDSGDLNIDLDAVDDLTRNTRLSVLGLSARELNAADRIGATTAGALLDLPAIRMYRNRGIGQRVIRRLRLLREELGKRLVAVPTASETPDEAPETLSVDSVTKRLTNIKLSSPENALLQAWLGLAGTATEELPTLRDVAERNACARSDVQDLVEKAVDKWMRCPWFTSLRDEAADFLKRREGVVTVDELAARLLSMRGSSSEGPERQRRVRAVVQALLEGEATHATSRFVLYRGARNLLIVATERLGEAFAASSSERAAYAEGLARRITELATEDPLPSARRVEEQLAAVPPPEDDAPISSDRRLRLGVAMSPNAALSSRTELYPRGLSAERALRLGSASLIGPKRLPVKQLVSRVQSRFDQAQPLPDRPELDALLLAAGIELVWREAEDGLPAGYAPPSRGTGLTMHSTSRRRSTGHVVENDADAERIARFEETLHRARRDGRVLILTCPLSITERAAQRLCATFELTPISLDRLLIDAMRAQAIKAKADWSIVLKADRAAIDAADWRNLQALVLRAMPSVRETVLNHPQPLLLQHAGLLVRYQQIGLLQELRNQAIDGRRPARLLLIPGDDGQPPILDGVVLPVITPADWVAVPGLWTNLKHEKSDRVA